MLANFPPAQNLELQPAFHRAVAFLANGLALAGGKLRQKIIERGVSFIDPVKLLAAADQKPFSFHQLTLRRLQESEMHGG